jgi:excisionase family DNA binding protein
VENVRVTRVELRKMADAGTLEVLTTEEAAALLRVSAKTVLGLARDGSLPGMKVGRAWRFLRADLLEHLHGEQRRRGEA